MKIGMVLLLLMVFLTAYLIGSAVRKSIKARRAQALAQARWVARWEVFADPEENEIHVGVRRVARVGKQVEVIDSQILTRVPCALPNDERDTEVRIAKGDARAYADTLNEN